jgi:hypothetical protein
LGWINYNAPSEKSTTHGDGSDQLTRTEGNSRPRHSEVAETAGPLRLGSKLCESCSFRLKDSSVTSMTVQRAFHGGGGIRHPTTRGSRARLRSRPLGRNNFPRRNELIRTDCGALKPSNKARQRAGSTTTHQAKNIPRTAREATNYHAPKEIAVRATRWPRRRPGLGGCDPRSMSYAPFVKG